MNTERALKDLWRLSFGDTEAEIDAFFAAAYSPDRRLYLTAEGRVAAALYWLDCSLEGDKLAYLYAVATHPNFRGRGLCHRLMGEAHRALEAQGYGGTVLVPGGPALFRLYAGMGYRVCGAVEEFTCPAGARRADLRAVGRGEYAARRRALLPPGGVVQEGENLALLEAQAALYAGPDFLLAAAVEDGVLFCPELLGDPASAPGIVAALGCRAGRFRTPGPGRPFAMYRPLTRGSPPSYFGLAFD